MTLTFENAIRHNKRVSIALMVLMIVFASFICGMAGVSLKSGNPFVSDADLWWTFKKGALIGAVLTVLGSLLSYFLGGWIIVGITGGMRVEHHDDPVLFNVVEEMAIAAGLPPPKIYAIGDDTPNAFATGRDPRHAIIGITTGLRRKLSRDELQAVIAHEMAHIKNYDIRLMMLVAVFAGMIVLISDTCWRMVADKLKPSPGSRRYASSRSRSKHGFLSTAMFALVGLMLFWIAPSIARLMQLAVSRQREYLADATAVQLCRNPLALAGALRKIVLDTDPLDCRNRALEHMYIINPVKRLSRADDDSIWSTHPPVIRRISILEKMAGEMGLTRDPEEEPGSGEVRA